MRGGHTNIGAIVVAVVVVTAVGAEVVTVVIVVPAAPEVTAAVGVVVAYRESSGSGSDSSGQHWETAAVA